MGQKQVEGAAIHDEVMEVEHKIDPLLGGDNLHAVERALPQIERLDEFPFVLVHLRLVMLAMQNLDRLVEINDLDDVGTRTTKMRLHLRMRLDEGFQCRGKQGDIHILGETDCHRDIIYGGLRLLYAIHINTHLRV